MVALNKNLPAYNAEEVGSIREGVAAARELAELLSRSARDLGI